MPQKYTDQFYSELPLNEVSVNQLVADEKYFFPVPDDWYVVITDIKKSTQAIKDGLHQVVNLIATGSVIAGLNLARKVNTTIPFFFGGDGATLLVPPSLIDPIMGALVEHRANTAKNFGLELRIGNVPITKIYQELHQLTISKVKMGDKFFIPVVLGAGLQYAEQIVKGADFVHSLPETKGNTLDLTGMECRWDRIKPPKNLFEVVSLLVTVRNKEEQAGLYKKVLDTIDEIYGQRQTRNPISVQRLKLQATLGKINLEMKTRLGRFDPSYLISNWLVTLFGKLVYFPFDKQGQHYLNRLVELSDTLVIDGKINTVISGTSKQRELLVRALDQLEQEGEILFGWYTSKESVMSCYVRDRLDQRIHFVDGSDGGYTNAAEMLKKKMLKLVS